jgi:uncharacterized protein (TIRG00374 family)
VVKRSLLLLVAGVAIYLLLPQLVDIFSAWPSVRELSPWWVLTAVGFEALSYLALWSLQRTAFRTRSWFTVATSQLSAGAAGQVVPGGGAAAAALQYRMLVRAGVAPSLVTSGLTASWALTTVAALGLPIVAILAALGGVAVPDRLAHVAYFAGAAFLLLVLLGAAGYLWDRPLRVAARALQWIAGRVRQSHRVERLPERLLEQRDRVGRAVAAHPWLALLSAVGKWGFDYLVLVCALTATGATPEPSLVLLAYAAGILLAMIPITPGGLGFVELGLVGMLTLAGVSASEATTATLAYRLVSYWLPLPCGIGAYLLYRRRYGSASAAATAAETSAAISSPP